MENDPKDNGIGEPRTFGPEFGMKEQLQVQRDILQNRDAAWAIKMWPKEAAQYIENVKISIGTVRALGCMIDIPYD